MSTDVIRDREEYSEQYRALKELKQMAASYGYDISITCYKCKRSRSMVILWLFSCD